MQTLKGLYNVTFEKGISSSYLVLESGYAVKVKDYQVEMIARNKIENILPLDIKVSDESTSLYYNITSQLPLSQWLIRRKISMDELVKILHSIGKALLESKEFLLSEKNFVIHEDYIFINPASIQVSLVYLPVEPEGDILKDYKDFILRLILNIADIDESASSNCLHKILASVKSATFNIKSFISMLESITEIKSSLYEGKESGAKERGGEKEVPENDTKEEVAEDPFATGKMIKEGKKIKGPCIEKNEKATGETGEVIKIKFMKEGGTGKDKGKNMKAALLKGMIAIQVALVVMVILNKYIVMPGDDNSLITFFGIALIVGAACYLLLKRLPAPGPEKEDMVPDQKEKNRQEDRIPKESQDMRNLDMGDFYHNVLQQPNQELGRELGRQFSQESGKHLESQSSKQLSKHWNCQLSQQLNNGLQVSREFNQEIGHSDTVLLSSFESRPLLKGTKKDNSEVIIISKGDFLIGRLKGYVDHVINNEAVGKIHAQIICLDNQYYIKDLNSVNGTYINNVRIESNKEYKIFDGDKITFANEDFVFVNPTVY